MCFMFQGLFTSVIERTQPMEQVNVDGGRFIREAKVRTLIFGACNVDKYFSRIKLICIYAFYVNSFRCFIILFINGNILSYITVFDRNLCNKHWCLHYYFI